MVSRNKLFITLLTFVLLLFVFNGCSDDSPTGAEEEPPQIPEAIPVEVDNSVFQNNNPTGEEFEAFNEAGVLALSANSNLMGTTSFGQGLLAFANNEEATFQNGKWVWEFTYSAQGESMAIKTTAGEVAGGVEWNMFISGSFDGEETLSEFPYLSGFVSNDGNTGNWQYQLPGQQEDGSIGYEWEIFSETHFTFSSVINFSDEDGEMRIDFERDSDDNFLEISGFNTSQDAVVYWNSSTGTGYIERPGEGRKCWDDTYRETACN